MADDEPPPAEAAAAAADADAAADTAAAAAAPDAATPDAAAPDDAPAADASPEPAEAAAPDGDAEGVDLSAWNTEMAQGLTDQTDRPRRQMVQLAHTNAQLKKIVEYNHGLVGEVVSKLRDDLIRPFFAGWKKALAEELEMGRKERKGIKLVGGVEEKMRGAGGNEADVPVVVGRTRTRDLFWHWYGFTKGERNDNALIKRATTRHALKNVALGFYALVGMVELKKRHVNIIRKVHKRLIGVRVACAWKGWHGHYMHEKHNRVKKLRMLKRLAYNTNMRSLNAWKAFVHQLKRQRHLVKVSVARVNANSQLAGFAGWYQWWTRRIHNRVVVARAVEKLTLKSLGAVFAELREATHALRVRKKRLAKGMHVSDGDFNAVYAKFALTPGSYTNKLQKLSMGLASWMEFIDRKKATRERVRVAAIKIAKGKVSRALHMWNQQIDDDHGQRASDETAARHDVEVQALMAEVDRLGIDNRRLIRQVEQLMGTQDVAASIEPKSAGGGGMTPRGTRRGGAPAAQEEDPGIGRIEHEVAKLHNVIAEMAEREERLLRMLQLPDVKPDPGPIKKGDFVRKNRALVHHTSSFNSLLRQASSQENTIENDERMMKNNRKRSKHDGNICNLPLPVMYALFYF